METSLVVTTCCLQILICLRIQVLCFVNKVRPFVNYLPNCITNLVMKSVATWDDREIIKKLSPFSKQGLSKVLLIGLT